eukprot:gene29068-36055_t
MGFVDALSEIFTPLCAGIPLYLFGDRAAKQPDKLITLLPRHRITRLVLVPSLLHTVLQLCPVGLEKQLPDLKFWEVSGEALTVPLARQFKTAFPSAKLVNMYGSSEVGPDASYHEVTIEDIQDDSKSIPIGRSLTNMKVFILNDDMTPVQTGEKGRIFVAGKGVASGYLNKPDLTTKAFINNPIVSERDQYPVLYDMGDIGSQTSDGLVRYHGRSDHQVKINGNRVELGEIEAVMRRLDSSITSCAVKFWPLSQSHGLLVAYIAHGRPSVVNIRALLTEALPQYMVPAQYIKLDALPLNNNGKIDRGMLLMPTSSDTESLVGSSVTVSPATEFSCVGVNSLMFAQLRAMIARELKVEVTLQQMLTSRNAIDLADVINSLELTTIREALNVSVFESPLKGIDHIEAVTELSNRVFCDSEPLTFHVRTTPAEFETCYKSSIAQAAREKLSVVAVKGDRVIGATIAIDRHYNDILTSDVGYRVAASQRPILNILESLYTSDVPCVAAQGREVSSLFTAVEPDFAGYDLSYTLEKLSIALATQQKYSSVVTELTSPLSQTTAKELGFELSAMRTYDSFIDSDQKLPFKGLSGGAQLGILRLIPPTFEDLYQYELLERPEDIRQTAWDCACSFVKHNPLIVARGVKTEEYFEIFHLLLKHGSTQKLSTLCRHKQSGEVASVGFSFDNVNSPLDEHLADYVTPPSLQPVFDLFDEIEGRVDFDLVAREQGPVGKVDFVYVSEKHMGHGLGKKQIAYMLHHLRNHGYMSSYTQFISEVTYPAFLDVLQDCTDEYTSEVVKYDEHVTRDGTKPFPGVDVVCI